MSLLKRIFNLSKNCDSYETHNFTYYIDVVTISVDLYVLKLELNIPYLISRVSHLQRLERIAVVLEDFHRLLVAEEEAASKKSPKKKTTAKK